MEGVDVLGGIKGQQTFNQDTGSNTSQHSLEPLGAGKNGPPQIIIGCCLGIYERWDVDRMTSTRTSADVTWGLLFNASKATLKQTTFLTSHVLQIPKQSCGAHYCISQTTTMTSPPAPP